MEKFDLGTDGDQLFIYCIDADGLENILWGFNYNGEWAPAGLTASQYGTNTSSLPEVLENQGSVVLPHMDNCKYDGALGGFKTVILSGFLDPSNYNCSDDNRFAVSFAMTPSVFGTLAGFAFALVALLL